MCEGVRKFHPFDGSIRKQLQSELPSDPDSYKRVFTHDHRFYYGDSSERDSEFRNPCKGVFMIGNSNIDPHILETIEKYTVKFDESLDCSETVKKYNMTNVSNWKNFRDDLKGLGFNDNELPNDKMARYNGSPLRGPEPFKIGDEDHYNNFYLSHLIKDFTQFGIEHVNIMLYTSRPNKYTVNRFGRETFINKLFTDNNVLTATKRQSTIEQKTYKNLLKFDKKILHDFMVSTGEKKERVAFACLETAMFDYDDAIRIYKENIDTIAAFKKVVEEVEDPSRHKSLKTTRPVGFNYYDYANRNHKEDTKKLDAFKGVIRDVVKDKNAIGAFKGVVEDLKHPDRRKTLKSVKRPDLPGGTRKRRKKRRSVKKRA